MDKFGQREGSRACRVWVQVRVYIFSVFVRNNQSESGLEKCRKSRSESKKSWTRRALEGRDRTSIINDLLFRNHLQVLSDLKDNLNDSKEYINDDELKVWFDLLLKLISNENEKEITKEVCKCFISIIHLRSLSIVDELDLFYEYLIENKSSILIEEILNELNKNEFLLNWIKCLCDKNKQIKSFEILYLFIDFYFKREEKEKDQIKQILFSFQHLILSQLLKQTETKIILNNEYELSYLINKYLNYIFKYSIQEKLQINDLIHSSLIGLCLMTDIPTNFVYKDIQPIFLSILPLLSQYYLLNINNEDSEFVCCLIGKISNVLIIGMPTDELEIKHKNKFESAVFAGGYVMNKDEDLLKSNLATYRSCLDMMSSNEEG